MRNSSTSPHRRDFLKTAAAAPAVQMTGSAPLDAVRIAARHSIVRTQPTPDFFEGLLLGNGDIGICITVRPDGLGLHLGKNDSWDIRVSEDHVEKMLTFDGVLDLWKRAGEQAKRQGKPDEIYLENRIDFFKQYTEAVTSSYRKPWPRPWPCGIIWLHWDSRMVRVLRQQLDVSTGLATINLEWSDLRGKATPVTLRCFVSREDGHAAIWSDSPPPVTSVAYYPHWDAQALLPEPALSGEADGFSCSQEFPSTPPKEGEATPVTDKDRSFALRGLLSGAWKVDATAGGSRGILLRPAASQALRLDIALVTSGNHAGAASHARQEAERLAHTPVAQLQSRSASEWAKFWAASAVEFSDPELEALWYRNQYFLACCLKPGKVAPGLFGNWTSGNIGTAWHGDYHMNYNTQQVWWGVFSSNHVEQHEPYTRLVENLMPMAEWNARVQFGLPGAYFPHSAYPVPSQVNPYPAPPWGYEICETPWTVQSLWWQYRYTLDKEYLRRVYPMLRAATDFLTAFLKKGEDGKYHVFPTVSPENWGCTVDFRLNKDCIIDIALTEFLLDAILEASTVLGADTGERERWKEVRRNLAPYPVVDGPYGKVWLDVLNAPAEWIYNVPVTLSPVFPGEQAGLDSNPELLELARRTARTVRLEGGNDLVWQPLARARLAMLDLEWFKREVRYCGTQLGVANDRVRQIGGRYSDRTNFSFMMQMGVWTENLSLPAVLNECLLQSYSGVIRLFPNTINLGKARYRNLRAAGAFLVSAAWDGRSVSGVSIHSEKGAPVRLQNPWPSRSPAVVRDRGARVQITMSGAVVEFPTEAGATYFIQG